MRVSAIFCWLSLFAEHSISPRSTESYIYVYIYNRVLFFQHILCFCILVCVRMCFYYVVVGWRRAALDGFLGARKVFKRRHTPESNLKWKMRVSRIWGTVDRSHLVRYEKTHIFINKGKRWKISTSYTIIVISHTVTLTSHTIHEHRFWWKVRIVHFV